MSDDVLFEMRVPMRQSGSGFRPECNLGAGELVYVTVGPDGRGSVTLEATGPYPIVGRGVSCVGFLVEAFPELADETVAVFLTRASMGRTLYLLLHEISIAEFRWRPGLLPGAVFGIRTAGTCDEGEELSVEVVARGLPGLRAAVRVAARLAVRRPVPADAP